MNTNTDELARKLALAERALLAMQNVMSQAREVIETARKAIADVQDAVHRSPAVRATTDSLARPA